MMDGKEHSIRFITSSYDPLFRIPDGGTVEIEFPDRKFSAKCEYVDDYHTKVGDTLYHICEFAELVEHQNGTVRPEPEFDGNQAAWQLGHREYLAVQTTDEGYDYSIYSRDFKLKDGGQLNAPELTMKEAREQILEMHGLSWRNRFSVSYDDVMEKAESAELSVLKSLDALKDEKLLREKPGKEKAHGGKER